MRLWIKENFKARELGAVPSFDGDYDVVVAGLGSGGAFAAAKAASLGLKTLGVERMDQPGGQSTIGCVCGTLKRRERNLRETRALLDSSGCEAAYETTVIGAWMEGRRISGLRLLRNGTVRDVKAKIVVDATGDASVSRMAGCDVKVGRESDHGQGATSKASIFNLPGGGTRMGYGFYRDSAECEGEAFSRKMLGYAARDARTLGRRSVAVKATIMGAREEGHVVCEDTYTLRDALCERKVSNPVFSGTAPFDLVRIDGDWAWENEDTIDWKEIACLSNFAFYAEMPYGALVAKGVEGLLEAGKHYGVAHDAGGGLRMQTHMRFIGEAAAAAAAVAIRKGCALRDVPYSELRPLLDAKRAFRKKERALDVIHRDVSMETFDDAAVAKALDHDYVHAGDWVTRTPRGPGEDMAWAYATCWMKHLRDAPDRRATADFLAARLDGRWGGHFAIALGLMRDARAVAPLVRFARTTTSFFDRLKALAALRRFRDREALALFREVAGDGAEAFTRNEADERGWGFAHATRDWKRFQCLSYALFALKESGEDMRRWRKCCPTSLPCGARDKADLAPMLAGICGESVPGA